MNISNDQSWLTHATQVWSYSLDLTLLFNWIIFDHSYQLSSNFWQTGRPTKHVHNEESRLSQNCMQMNLSWISPHLGVCTSTGLGRRISGTDTTSGLGRLLRRCGNAACKSSILTYWGGTVTPCTELGWSRHQWFNIAVGISCAPLGWFQLSSRTKGFRGGCGVLWPAMCDGGALYMCSLTSVELLPNQGTGGVSRFLVRGRVSNPVTEVFLRWYDCGSVLLIMEGWNACEGGTLSIHCVTSETMWGWYGSIRVGCCSEGAVYGFLRRLPRPGWRGSHFDGLAVLCMVWPWGEDRLQQTMEFEDKGNRSGQKKCYQSHWVRM